MADSTCVQSLDPETIKFDEKLAKKVRKFVCLYDKTSKDYKDKFVVANAWVKLVENQEANTCSCQLIVFSLPTFH